MPSSQPELYIGLMSGTSMDGIDAALVDFSGPQPKLINTHNHPWPEDVQQALIEARELPDDELSSLNALDLHVAKIFAEACVRVLEDTPEQRSFILPAKPDDLGNVEELEDRLAASACPIAGNSLIL